MEILLIGNGFDLEHALPTTYNDFLDFIRDVNSIENLKYIEKMDFNSKDEYVKDYLRRKLWNDEHDEHDEIVTELVTLSKQNIWIDYFNEKKYKIRKNWIDFESEIANVIKALDYMKKHIRKRQENKNDDIKVNFILEEIFFNIASKMKIEQYSQLTSEEYMNEIVKPLEDDLKKLIRCLEIYLDDCVNKMDITYKSPDIKLYDKVISFNYTNTYQRVYTVGDSKVVKYDYIHGKADSNKKCEDNNMILGIDEYLNDEEKDKEIDFITFKKYYQRMFKESKCDYKQWLNSSYNGTSNKNEKIEVTIFGHSLDVTDKDILKEIILHENVKKVTIYYYDKETYGKQIANLVKVIGQENLKSNFYGKNKKIFFKQQDERKKYEKNTFSDIC